MAITDAGAVRFCNEHIRTSADMLSRCFYLLQKLRNDWNNVGSTDAEKFQILQANIAAVSEKVASMRSQLFRSKRLYDALNMNTFFPNDPAEAVVDGSPNDGRGTINGQDVRRINARTKEFLAWTEKGVFDDASLNPVNYTFLEQLLKCTTSYIDVTVGKQVANGRAGDLVTEWTVTNAVYLGQITKVAVNGNQLK